jgi:NAD(P)H dehydrogenase (quinone)
MKTIAIVYYSGSGHTRLLAEAVARAAVSVPGIQIAAHAISGGDIHEGRFQNAALFATLDSADAIVFGTPTYMGGVAAQFKAFADATGGIWYRRGWKDKLAAGFTHSGSPSGDKLATLQYLSLFAAQHGMLWLGNTEAAAAQIDDPAGLNRTGTYLGVAGFGGEAPGQSLHVHAGDLHTAEALGRRVADVLRRFETTAQLAAA